MNKSKKRLLNILLVLGGLLCVVWLTMRGVRVDSAAQIDIPPGFEASLIIDRLTQPVDMMFLPSGDLWVLEKGAGDDDTDRATAELYAIRNGRIVANVLQLNVNPTGDGGALAMVLDPDFGTNNYFYVWYVMASGGERSTARLSRFTYDPAVGTADLASEREVISVRADSSSRNFGSALLFDNEGYLLIGTGDFDLEETPAPQSSLNLISKILRIKPNHTGSTAYTVSGNPFENVSTYLPEIYAMGARNPYRMVKRAADGLILMGDVGGSHWEEVNELEGGANYGWPEREGVCEPGTWQPCTPTPFQFTNPFYAYQHEFTSGQQLSGAITGLTFYEGNNFSPFVRTGNLLYSDYPLGYIKVLDTETGTARTFIEGLSAPVELEFRDNLLYILDIVDGSVTAVRYTNNNNSAPTAELQASSNEFYTSPVTVTFTANAADPDGDPLTFLYDFGDGTTLVTTQTTVAHTYSSDQTVTARLTATDSNNTPSLPSSETVTIYSGEWPTVSLDNVTRQLTETYHAGDAIIYEAQLSDTTGLAAEPYRWEVLLHHGAHIHAVQSGLTGSANIINIPTENHDGDINVWYEWVLTLITDTGQPVRVTQEAFPELMSYWLTSNLADVGIIANGQLITTTSSVDTIIGIENTLVGTFKVENGLPFVAESYNSGDEVYYGREHTFIADPARDVWLVNYSSSPYRVFLPFINVRP